MLGNTFAHSARAIVGISIFCAPKHDAVARGSRVGKIDEWCPLYCSLQSIGGRGVGNWEGVSNPSGGDEAENMGSIKGSVHTWARWLAAGGG